MTIRDGEPSMHIPLLEHMNISMVKDQTRIYPDLLNQIIRKLEERSVDDRTREEDSFLELTRAIQFTQNNSL